VVSLIPADFTQKTRAARSLQMDMAVASFPAFVDVAASRDEGE
jgi:hypothetical protein